MNRYLAYIILLSTLVAPALSLAGEHAPRATYGEVLQWYFDAAEAGNAEAQFLLALKYETGTDVPRDASLAADWFEKAARQGHLEAQFKFASALENGQGRAADPAAAEQWYERAAKGGYAPAQYNLGVLRLNNASTDARRIDSLIWLLAARDQGMAPAAELLARLEGLWPAELFSEAQRRAADSK